MPDLERSQVVWVNFNPTKGSEQAGHRPALVISTDEFNSIIPNVVVVLPVTTRDRGLPHHVRLQGPDLSLDQESYAMTEQPRTIDRQRITGTAGNVDLNTMKSIDLWLRDFLGLR
ncbi:type II toxin-antitoxin system PemK/MazF family toxin [Sinomonas terrae]|uniref:mRNA interferase n=1 Tax=Sinomonas terrae TaxID=2908838 RepID=A0ABS9U7A5_9MICC|nr:type II toxin-antitoxin system PemK/MazF family toxin [Sinomonas terrae]MCH6472565.1 type II toxin-antitoxin system PemK/MazF family toxin [Sinomonas terrae]